MSSTSAETFTTSDCRCVSLRRAVQADHEAIATLLRDLQLPTDGVSEWLDQFWVAEHQRQSGGCGRNGAVRGQRPSPLSSGGAGVARHRCWPHPGGPGARGRPDCWSEGGLSPHDHGGTLLPTPWVRVRGSGHRAGGLARLGGVHRSVSRLGNSDVPSHHQLISRLLREVHMSAPGKTFRVLFLCTGNSARSQIAEKILNRKGHGRFVAESAGSQPAAHVNQLAVEALERHGYFWTGGRPRGLDGLPEQDWDFVITVCDRAKEACPFFPGQPVIAHWGMPDPADVMGTDQEKRRAFDDTVLTISRRLDLFLALPIEKLSRLALEHRVREIGTSAVADPVAESILNHALRSHLRHSRQPASTQIGLRPHHANGPISTRSTIWGIWSATPRGRTRWWISSPRTVSRAWRATTTPLSVPTTSTAAVGMRIPARKS